MACIYHGVWSTIPHDDIPLIIAINEMVPKLGEVDEPGLMPLDFRFSFTETPILHAYRYRFFTCIASAVKQLWLRYYTKLLEPKQRQIQLKLMPNWESWFEGIFKAEPSVSFFCLGECPFADFAGFIQFLQQVIGNKDYFCTNIDQYNWFVESRETIILIQPDNAFEFSHFSDQNFNHLDELLDQELITEKLKTAHVISLVMFLSTIFIGDPMPAFVRMLQMVQKSTLVFFMDKTLGGYYDMMYHSAFYAGLQCIGQVESEIIPIEGNELDLMRDNHYTIFPQQSIRICSSLWVKV